MPDHAGRLRMWAEMYDEDGGIYGRLAPGQLREAAALIDQLQAENQRLKDLIAEHQKEIIHAEQAAYDMGYSLGYDSAQEAYDGEA